VEIKNGVLPYNGELKLTPQSRLLNVLDVINKE